VTGKAVSLSLLVLLMAACSESSSGTRLTVLAASSLKEVFPQIGTLFTEEHDGVTISFSFGGTDQLSTQIQEGAPADVFAGASTKYGDHLASAGLIDPYESFCTNQLVLLVPSSNPGGITSLLDLSSKPAKLVIGSESVPIGAYTRAALENLNGLYGPGYSEAVLGRVVSNEDSAASIVAKVESGEADAGFAYVTDALAAGSRVQSIPLPSEAQAVAIYPIAVVTASKNTTLARQLVEFVLSTPAQQLLERAGFGSPPVP
jgi:molybdate transport system substrate-binding protein